MKHSFLLERRKALDLSQNDIANILGYSTQMVSLWESGKSIPNLSVWSKYASLLQVDLEGFIFDKVQKKNDLCNTDKFDVNNFARTIKRLRKDNDYTQQKFAEILDTNNKTISSWENGSSVPSLNQFLTIVELFNCSIEDLYFSKITIDSLNVRSKHRFLKIGLPIALCALLAVSATITTLLLNKKSSPEAQNGYESDAEYHWKLNSDGEPIEKVEHIFDGVITKQVSCVEDGEMTYTCEVCNYQKKEVIYKTGHTSDGTWHFDMDYHYHVCERDGVKYDKTLHDYDDGTMALRDNVKYYDYYCKTCGHFKAVKIGDYIVHEKTMYFGEYPQTRVTDEELISVLDTLTDTDERGYYFYNEHYYAKEIAHPSTASHASYRNKFIDYTTIVDGQVYWFNVEPVNWMILDQTEDYYLLFSDIVIDTVQYAHQTNPSSNYENSYVREWLNNSFYQRVFTDKTSLLLTEVDNSPASTMYDINVYACNNTFDYVFLPSIKELSNQVYGLGDNDQVFYNNKLMTFFTDYSLVKGLYVDYEFKTPCLTRSPSNSSPDWVRSIGERGHFADAEIYSLFKFYGCRPMIRLSTK